jgi:ubiquinone/menaquinone biosynthesis C-methylase UbiE
MSRADGATAEWRRIARNENVLYSIAGDPAKRESGWSEDEFYESGRSDWADFERRWRQYAPGLAGTCVEIGCGAGRITRALAGSFDRVVALDVADEMIAMASAAAPANAEFVRVDGPEIPLADATADAVFSCHVLQHLETDAAVRAYLREARRVLRPGSSAMLHLTVSSAPRSRLWRAREELRLRLSRARLRRGEQHTAVRMRVYRPEDVVTMLAEAGFGEVEQRSFAVRSNGYRHDFFFGVA